MSTTKYKAVVFDMDDTLIKTYAVKLRQHRHFAKQQYGIELDDEHFRKQWGKPFHTFLSDVYEAREPVERIYSEYIKLSHLYPVELQDDTLHTFDRLQSGGHKLGIVTATARDVVMRDLGLINFPFERLHMLQTSDDTPVHKPDPKVFEPILGSLRNEGITEGIVYVGDALTDYYAARDAGLQFVGVTTGLVTADEFREAGAEYIVDRLSQIPDLVLL